VASLCGHVVVGLPRGLRRIDKCTTAIWKRRSAICWEKPLAEAREQLSAYFAGERKSFDLKLNPGGTEFQMQVLDELQKIPYGTTTSYGDIANRIGRPKATRAVGAANGRNPIPIIIPCHRVIGSSGAMTGFGGGIPTKEALLRLELEHSQFPHAD